MWVIEHLVFCKLMAVLELAHLTLQDTVPVRHFVDVGSDFNFAATWP